MLNVASLKENAAEIAKIAKNPKIYRYIILFLSKNYHKQIVMKNKTSLIKSAATIPTRKPQTRHPTPAKLRTRRKASEHS